MKYLPRILIVDDESHFLTHMASTLRKNGFDVYSLLDGEEVFSIVRTYKPDIIIIDIRLGTHDGRLICHQVKTEFEFNSKIILHSVLSEFGEGYKKYGADDFIQKPFTLDSLIAKINFHLEK